MAIAYAHGQTVPNEVKQAIAASVKASNTKNTNDKEGGFHEEGGMWGLTADGSPIVIIAKPGATSPKCTNGASLVIGDAKDPSLTTRIVSISGEWHVHPRGTYYSGNGQLTVFSQPPSAVDIQEALAPINIVIGARDNVVYFYTPIGITSTMKLKEFLRQP